MRPLVIYFVIEIENWKIKFEQDKFLIKKITMKTAKWILATALTLGILTGVRAQEEKEMKFLINPGQTDISISGFGGPIVGFTMIGDEFAVTTGGGGAAIFNQSFYIGGYGEGLVTRHLVDLVLYDHSIGQNREYSNLHTQFGHGGLWLGYIHNPHNAIHWGISSKVGFGSASLTENTYNHDYSDDLEYDNFFLLSPQIEVEMNLTQWFRLNFGVGYQLVTGLNKEYEFQDGNQVVLREYFDQSDFNKPIGHVTLCFGWFNN